MGKVKQILIIGCSVSLRVRPPESQSLKNLNYGKIIENELNKSEGDALWVVKNKGISRAITRDVLLMKDEFGRNQANYVILNIGAVDAPNREIPLWFSDVLHYKRRQSFYKLFNFLNHYLIKGKMRSKLVLLRGKRSWTSKNKFTKDIHEIIDSIKKDSPSKIIVLGINSGNKRIEQILPGTMEKYKEYNLILKQISMEKKCSFIDVSDLESDKYFPDGVHYNQLGHGMVSKRLLQQIK
ncbi:MAG: SGNH/GDSL hydrolase family protein [Brumimicrobium sp.]